MAVTYGFYNSLLGDRKYNATQMSSLFDGIIRDGILMAVGNRFIVKPGTGMGLTVGSGRAWFNRTWTYNDSDMPINVRNSELLLDRIDALVIEIDARDESRMNSIRWVYGTPSTVPIKPTLTKSPYLNQYPLAYVTVVHGTTVITQANIENMIGTSQTPYVTGPLEILNSADMLAQWDAQWKNLSTSMSTQKTQQQTSWETQMNSQKTAWDVWFALIQTEIQAYTIFNFDNLSALIGVTRTTAFTTTDVTETIRTTAGSALIATRVFTYSTMTTVETVYQNNGVSILRQRTITITFPSGTISEVVV